MLHSLVLILASLLTSLSVYTAGSCRAVQLWTDSPTCRQVKHNAVTAYRLHTGTTKTKAQLFGRASLLNGGRYGRGRLTIWHAQHIMQPW